MELNALHKNDDETSFVFSILLICFAHCAEYFCLETVINLCSLQLRKPPKTSRNYIAETLFPQNNRNLGMRIRCQNNLVPDRNLL
jgi:hypothetical protein